VSPPFTKQSSTENHAACAGAAFVQLCVQVPVEVAAARNASRAGAQRVPADVFARLAAAWESPVASRHAFERATLVVDTTDRNASSTAEDAWRRLCTLWATCGPATRAGPTQEELHHLRSVGQAGNAASDVHSWDMRARAAMTAAVTAGASRECTCMAFIHACSHLTRL